MGRKDGGKDMINFSFRKPFSFWFTGDDDMFRPESRSIRAAGGGPQSRLLPCPLTCLYCTLAATSKVLTHDLRFPAPRRLRCGAGRAGPSCLPLSANTDGHTSQALLPLLVSPPVLSDRSQIISCNLKYVTRVSPKKV